jgi:NADH-quinone oxidoreductase subunit C
LSLTPSNLVDQLRERFGSAILGVTEFRGEWTVSLDPAQWLAVARFLRDEAAFPLLSDLSGVDHYGEEPRFEVHATVYSLEHRFWFHLSCRAPGDTPEVDSLTSVWSTADWHEREAFDMYGIRFTGHPGLRRILMWEGYPHHPLRKDFPLAGLPAELPATARDAGRAEPAPMADGPFVATGGVRSLLREPRQFDTLAVQRDQAAAPVRQEEV